MTYCDGTEFELEKLLDRMAEGRAQRPTVWGLIEAWRALVEEVELGCDRSLFEYRDALRVRQDLGLVAAECAGIAHLAPGGDRLLRRALPSDHPRQ